MKTSTPSKQRSRKAATEVLDLRRAYRRELRRVLTRAAHKPDAGDVHAVRKGITRLRSWLRLSRELLGPGRHRTHDHRLRRAARTLAPFRDARVRLDAFLAIASATKLPVTGLHLRRRLRRTESSMPAAMRRVERILEKELHSAARLPLKALPRPECAAALERMRAEMDAAFVAGRASGDIELLHKWRKRTKNYLHALAFVESRKNPRHRSAVRINRLLGLDHDLALLESGLTERLDKPETQLLLAQIAKRRAKLRGQLFG